MKINCFLIINSRGSFSVRKNKPGLDFDEIAIKLNLELPDMLFRKPQLEAVLSIDETAVQPAEITPEIVINTKELIEQTTGMKVDLKVVPMEESNAESNS